MTGNLSFDASDFEPLVLEPESDELEQLELNAGHEASAAGDGTKVMRWMLAPLPLETFMTDCFERRPVFVSRSDKCEHYYEGWFGMEEMDRMLKECDLQYTYNVDVTNYMDGKRRTLNSNEDGTTDTAAAASVWAKYKAGCSVRMLHPQRFSEPLWKMLSALESFWTSAVGCNTYLTPENAQGFAPHWDDIDAFILQVEGRKRWKVYAPREPEEVLPRASSDDFTDAEVGEPVLEVELCKGDLLYLPRGFIHQASCVAGSHSLHMTVSANASNTFADLLDVAVAGALALTTEEEQAMRQSLPPDYVSYMGVMHADDIENPKRAAFQLQVNRLMSKVFANLPVDDAADQMAVMYLKQRLPLYTAASRTRQVKAAKDAQSIERSAKGRGKASAKGKQAACSSIEVLTLASKVQMVAKDAARLLVEGEEAQVYHVLDNTRGKHMDAGGSDDGSGETPGLLVFELDAARLIEELLRATDTPMCFANYDPEEADDLLSIAQVLYEKGILVTV